MVTQQLGDLVLTAIQKLVSTGELELATAPQMDFERPKRKEHGDWSTNVALTLPRGSRPPRDLAQAIIDALPASDLVSAVEVAGPGFINFHLAPIWLHDVVRRAADPHSGFGRTAEEAGSKINVEFVSSNPTGPVNVVSGRHAAAGDAIANLLVAIGYDATREFYVNDVGRQIVLFGASIGARYLEALGQEVDIPEGGYPGDYVKDLAESILKAEGPGLADLPEQERNQRLAELGVEQILERMGASLESFGTSFDVWLRESRLHDSGAVQRALSDLKQRGLIEEREGALWFLSSRFGDDKDRVVVRSSGETTYLASDIAYIADKFGRAFDHLVYVWGADHHGTVPRLLAAAQALDFEVSKVEVRLVQIVTVSRGGESVKGSKRQGVFIPLDELVAEVGRDAARYMFLTRSVDAPLDFDIELAKEQAPENPVYYVQYAHARICSILRRAKEEGVEADAQEADLSVLHHPSEADLMRKIASYEEVVPDAARGRAPQKITRYVEELASVFSAFYRDCKVISDDRPLSAARLSLCLATRSVIADALGLLGVSAPERM